MTQPTLVTHFHQTIPECSETYLTLQQEYINTYLVWADTVTEVSYPLELCRTVFCDGTVINIPMSYLSDNPIPGNSECIETITQTGPVPSSDPEAAYYNASGGGNTSANGNKINPGGGGDGGSPEFIPSDGDFIPEIYYFNYDYLGNTHFVYHVKFDKYCKMLYLADFLAEYSPFEKTLFEYTFDKKARYYTTQHERDAASGYDYRGAVNNKTNEQVRCGLYFY